MWQVDGMVVHVGGGGAGGAVAGKDWPNRLEFGHSEPGVYRICGVLDELNWTLVRSP